MLILAIIFVFAAIVCLVLGLAWREEGLMSLRLATLRGERPMVDFRAAPEHESITSRVFAPMAESFGGKLESILPSRFLEGIEKSLVQAGQPVSLTGFLFAWLISIGTLIS